jgi:hypothetical protein
MALSENEVIIPALIAMYNSPNHEIQTSDLIEEIEDRFTLDNQDRTMLLNRNDEKFTQIVRNLKSHKTLHELGHAVEITGGFRLTPAGVKFLKTYGFIK